VRERLHGCLGAQLQGAEALAPRLTGALQPVTAAWDALAVAPRDAKVDAHSALLPQRVAGAGKSAVQARDALELDALRRRLEPRAAPAAAPAALELCKPDVDPFAERSCAARLVAERMAGAQMVKRSPPQLGGAAGRKRAAVAALPDATVKGPSARMQLAVERKRAAVAALPEEVQPPDVLEPPEPLAAR
jgi:hypothetical protein